MATSKTKFTKAFAGKNTTPKGVMPEDMLTRHGLRDVALNGATDASYKMRRHGRKMKKMFEGVKVYRALAHKVYEPQLASTLKHAVHFLVTPLGKGGAPLTGVDMVAERREADVGA